MSASGTALDEPTRRRLYDYVVRQPAPVSRDDLEAYGFEPRLEGDHVTLANCPFHTLAQERTLDRLSRTVSLAGQRVPERNSLIAVCSQWPDVGEPACRL